jgi:hypothetical protein
MATNQRSQIPSKFDFLGRDQKITQPWQFWLQGLESGLAPIGSGYVIDSTLSTTGSTSIGQGAQSGRTGSPTINSIYFADDTGGIFTVAGGQWQQQTPAYTGDVTKPAFSTITSLATVNAAPGTYGSSTTVPIITVDAKGRTTNVGFAPVEMPALPGFAGDVIFRGTTGQPAANGQLNFDPISGNLYIGKQITFANAIPTFTNLSPLTTKGDVIGFDGNINVRVPVGTDGYVLTANAAASSGLSWSAAGSALPAFIEIPFNYGDASPKPLTIVPANKMVLMSSIVIKTALNGVGATLQIGSTGTPGDVMPTTDNAPSVQSNWTNNPDTVYGSDTQIYLTINNGSGATAGSGLVILQIQT